MQGATVTGWAKHLASTWPTAPGCVVLEAHDKRSFNELVRLAELGEERRPSTPEVVAKHLGLNPAQRSELVGMARDVLGQASEGTPVWYMAALCFNALLSSAHREVLGQLVKSGPVWDGHIASKVHRDELMSMGLAGRACVKGAQGFTAANYIGWNVHHALEVLRAQPQADCNAIERKDAGQPMTIGRDRSAQLWGGEASPPGAA